MQITLHRRRQALEPARGRAGREGRLERRGVGGIVEDFGEEAGGRGGYEHGEHGRGGELRGEEVGYGA